MHKLRIKYGEKWKEISIQSQTFRIGRASDNDYVIDSGFISRHHCQIVCENQTFVLEDLGSKIGTLLNGKTVTRKAIRFGDRIQLGRKFEAEFLEEKNVLNTETLKAQRQDLQTDTERLVALDGPLANQFFNLDKNLIRIGRQMDNEICLPLDTISKYHAELVREPKGFTLIDLQSGNGTYVGNNRVVRQRLKSGDIIRFDWVSFRFEDTHFRLGKSGTRIRSKPNLPHLASTEDEEIGLLGSYEHPLVSMEETREQPKPKRSIWSALLTTAILLTVLAAVLLGLAFLVLHTDVSEQLGLNLKSVFFETTHQPAPVGEQEAGDHSFVLKRVSVHPEAPTRGQLLIINAQFEVYRDDAEITTKAQLFHQGEALLQSPPLQQRRWPLGFHEDEFAIQIPMLAEPGTYQVMVSFYGAQGETSRLIPVDIRP